MNPEFDPSTLNAVLNKVKTLQRYDLQWEWMRVHPQGEFLKYEDVESWLLATVKAFGKPKGVNK